MTTESPRSLPVTHPREVGPLVDAIVAEVEHVVVGKRSVIELVLAG